MNYSSIRKAAIYSPSGECFAYWEMSEMEVHVDTDICGGCQLCADACPELFEFRNDKAVVRMEKMPNYFYSDCCYASSICPNQAITVIEILDGTYDLTR